MIGFKRWAQTELKRRKIQAPSPQESRWIKILILLGVAALGFFVWWFARVDYIGFWPLYLLLTTTVGFKLLKLLHEWYHYWHLSVPEETRSDRSWTVDMLTTFVAGEPYDMIAETLRAMVAVSYPHRTFLCDEADDPFLKQLCSDLGVVHVYRGKQKTHAKAGNINYALSNFAEGEIAVILDPDHVPAPDFLDRVLPYFEDPEMGYVQCVQTYGNIQESFVAKGAAEQTYTFYGPMMMGMNTYGTVQAIGANCTFRRAALDAIGGHAPGLSEDMHTAMRIHAQGWKSIYVPEQLTRGRVPSNLQAYYKQQLKWSRGTFDLLFRIYPRLFRKFTWRQKLHYLLLPLHFFSGVITFLDILIPVLSLFLALVPWKMDLIQLAQAVTPLLILMLLIRQYAQRWMLEEQERGFHLLGGILWAGTWWYSLVGFVYAIFNVKVPYIPTPKEDDFTDAWGLSLPNMIAIGVSITAIVVGLSLDWNPYSMAMAGFAGINVGILSLAVLMGQQKTMSRLQELSHLGKQITSVRSFWWNFRHYYLYRWMRSGASIMAFTAILCWGSYLLFNTHQLNLERAKVLSEDEPNAFFVLGTDSDAQPGTLHPLELVWQPGLMNEQEARQWDATLHNHQIPLINWLPSARHFPDLASQPDLATDRYLLGHILYGDFDAYLRAFGERIRSYQDPVFIRFAPFPDDTMQTWSSRGLHCPQDYRNAWEYVVGFMQRQGIGNLVWVWEAQNPAESAAYLPRPEFVDWLSLTTDANLDKLHQWQDSLPVLKGYQRKPFLLHLTGSAEPDWSRFPDQYAQVRGLLLPEITSSLATALQSPDSYWQTEPSVPRVEMPGTETVARKSFTRQVEGKWELAIPGGPAYVKGIAYNATHDWRDGFLPLTRQQLEKDFSRIRAMGANTIRRFDAGGYDYNILNIAQEQDLHVLYGFWLEPDIDYARDEQAKQEIRDRVRHYVQKHKAHPALLGWTLGNETWTSLKFQFRVPYLIKVRIAYLEFLNELAHEIHLLDPDRPVITALEHSNHLPTLLRDIQVLCPEIDLMGVNTFDGERMAQLSDLMDQYLAERPYLITSFGPRKYWDGSSPEFLDDDYLPAVGSYEKAQVYSRAWKDYIQPQAGRNLGGFAYCWSDRLEGAATWFGITDFKGRTKPAYYALKSAWTGTEVVQPLANVRIVPPEFQPLLREFQDYHTVSPNNLRKDLKYEYLLLREDTQKEAGKLAKLPLDRPGAFVSIPEPGSYRLYVYISDEAGNVSTASHRIVYFEPDELQ